MTNQVIKITLLTFLCACSVGAGDDIDSELAPDLGFEAADRGAAEPETLPDPVANLVPEPIASVDELPGDWYRPFALPGQVSYLVLAPPQLGIGEYNGFRSCGVPICYGITGSYHAVPENPAVGFAFLQLRPAGSPTFSEIYILDHFWRAGDGTLVAVQARRLYEGGAPGLPFQLYRVGEAPAQPEELIDADEDAVLELANQLDAPDLAIRGELDDDLATALVAERADGFSALDDVGAAADRLYAADPALCSYYRGREQYFQLRALQCAYSVCYPMSPWYGYWAQYYRNLADSVCPAED